jgi:hypothetical protein
MSAPVMAWLTLGCALALLSECTSSASREDGGGGAEQVGPNGARGGVIGAAGGSAGSTATDAGGSSGATGVGGDAGTVTCAAGRECPPGRICVPDPRGTCVTGEPCAGICVTGSGICLNVMPPDSGVTSLCAPNERVVTCRPLSCEGSNDCLGCAEATTTSCDPATPCLGGKLCLAVRACANRTECGSVCVSP